MNKSVVLGMAMALGVTASAYASKVLLTVILMELLAAIV